MPLTARSTRVAAMASALSLILAPGLARADAIYGCWMHGSERLTVDHDRVVTPGGASPEAQIDRHSASYLAPAGERDAGSRLLFRQLNDNEVARGAMDPAGGALRGEPEIWTPCRQAETS